jgi:DNA-binding MltR family transcriptional regulator
VQEELSMGNWKPLKLENLSEELQKIYDILNEESDFTCVLIGASYLAELLASYIEVIFIKGDTSKKILDPQRGALGGFATRADLAYCLNLINKNVYQDLIRVAEIRNLFAHKHLALDFGDTEIRKKCEELTTWRTLLDDSGEELPAELSTQQLRIVARNQFNMSVIQIGSRIHLDALSKEKNYK